MTEAVLLQSQPAQRERSLLGQLFSLALPVLAEHVLHIMVGLNDTYLANHLPQNKAAATAAVGTVGYLFWFIGLFAARLEPARRRSSPAPPGRAIAGVRTRHAGNRCCSQPSSGLG